MKVQTKHDPAHARRMAEMLRHQSDIARIEGSRSQATKLEQKAARWETIAAEAEGVGHDA